MIKLIFFITAVAVIIFGVIIGVGALLHYIEERHPHISRMTTDDDV